MLLFLSISAKDFITADFERSVVKGENSERLQGIIYCRRDRIALQITSPVEQRVLISGNLMFIYYPNHNRAFKIRAKTSFTLPFAEALLSNNLSTKRLSERGFKLTRCEIKGAKLYAYWTPPRKLRKLIKMLLVVSKGDKALYAEIRSPNAKPITKIWFKKHVELDNRLIPLEIEIERGEVKEKIVFRDVHLTSDPPEWVIDFKLPENTRLKEVKW